MSYGLTRAALRDRIVERTHLPKRVVAQVLDAATLEMKLELMRQGEVHLRGLLRIYTIKKHVSLPDGRRQQKIMLHTRPVRAFRKALNSVLTPEAPMDKYAVVTDEEMNKTASKKGDPCPQCGSTQVDYSGLIPHCPRCGTQPWEKQKRG